MMPFEFPIFLIVLTMENNVLRGGEVSSLRLRGEDVEAGEGFWGVGEESPGEAGGRGFEADLVGTGRGPGDEVVRGLELAEDFRRVRVAGDLEGEGAGLLGEGVGGRSLERIGGGGVFEEVGGTVVVGIGGGEEVGRGVAVILGGGVHPSVEIRGGAVVNEVEAGGWLPVDFSERPGEPQKWTGG